MSVQFFSWPNLSVLLLLILTVRCFNEVNNEDGNVYTTNTRVSAPRIDSPVPSYIPPLPNDQYDNRGEVMLEQFLIFVIQESKNSSEACYAKGQRPGIFNPPAIARGLKAIASSMYDTWTRYHPTAQSFLNTTYIDRVPTDEVTLPEKAEAITYAAYFIMQFLIPNRVASQNLTGIIENTLNLALILPPTTRPGMIAFNVSQLWFDYLTNDNSNQFGCYADNSGFIPPNPVVTLDNKTTISQGINSTRGPFGWAPFIKTGFVPAPRPYTTPHYGTVRTFAVNPLDILPPAPPSANISTQMFADVLTYQQILPDNGGYFKTLAEFWADGPASTSPPGHWTEISFKIARQKNYTLDQSVKFFFILDSALADAASACWFAKRYYCSVRPATFIPMFLYPNISTIIPYQYRGPYCPFGDIPAYSWQPYQLSTFITPPFPEYTSGHSSFSAAAATAIAAYTGSPFFPVPYTWTITKGSSLFEPQCYANGTNMYGATCKFSTCAVDGNYTSENHYGPTQDIVLGPWMTYKEAADSAGISRIYGGIHISAADLAGRQLGASVGNLVFAKACDLMEGACTDSFVLSSPTPSPSPSNPGSDGSETSGASTFGFFYSF